MTALVRERSNSMERWTHHLFPLKSGTKAYKNGKAAIEIGTGKIVPVSADPDQLEIGVFDETVDALLAEAQVNVNLGMEIEGRWWAQDGSIAADDVGKLCYGLDDQTVGLVGAGPISGRIWLVDATDGVFVQKLESLAVGAGSGAGGGGGELLALPAFASNASVPLELENGGKYDVPATAAASTVDLPDGDEGAVIYLSADGVKNGHTVQYRDGTTPITTALTASKRHLVVALFLDGTWRANAYVSP
jgi:hypothetical protein